MEHVQQLHSTHIDDSEAEGEEDTTCITCPVSNGEAMKMFEKHLTWLQHQPEASPYNTSVLPSLKELAAKKRFSQLKQTRIT